MQVHWRLLQLLTDRFPNPAFPDTSLSMQLQSIPCVRCRYFILYFFHCTQTTRTCTYWHTHYTSLPLLRLLETRLMMVRPTRSLHCAAALWLNTNTNTQSYTYKYTHTKRHKYRHKPRYTHIILHWRQYQTHNWICTLGLGTLKCIYAKPTGH